MNTYWAVLRKDLRNEMRTRQILASTVVFAMLVLLTFNFSFDLRGVDLVTLAPGVLWITFIFSGILGLGRVFVSEHDANAFEALILAPVDRGLIFLAKWTVSLLLLLLTELVTLVIFSAVFNINVFSPLILLDIFLGTAGFSAIGTSLAVVAFNSRAREVMLPLLMLPLVVPVVIGSVRVTSLVLTPDLGGGAVAWLNLLAAFDILFLAVCYYSFGFLLED